MGHGTNRLEGLSSRRGLSWGGGESCAMRGSSRSIREKPGLWDGKILSGCGVGRGGDLWVGAWCLGGCVAVVWPHIEEPHGFQYCHQAARHLRL